MTDKPHVTYAIQDLDASGAMRAPYLVLKGFAAAGWDAEIATTASAHNAQLDCVWGTVPVERVEGITRPGKLLGLAMRLLRRPRSEVVLSFVWDWHCFALALARRLNGKPYVLALDTYIHHSPADSMSVFQRWWRELRYGTVLRNADLILAEAPPSFDHAQRAFPKTETLLVPFSLWRRDLEAIEAQWAREGFAPPRAPVILYAGRIVARKHIPDLVEAFSRVAQEFPEWTLELRVLSADADELTRVRALIEQAQLQTRVMLVPPLASAELYKRYRETAIVALPSEGEGLPTAITEAMYFGGAIVAGRSGFVGYQLQQGKCGLLYPPGDVDALTAHLRTLMGSEETRRTLREGARARMIRLFTWESYFSQLEEKLRAMAEAAA